MRTTRTSYRTNLHATCDRGDNCPRQINALLRRHGIPSMQWSTKTLDTFLREKEMNVDDRLEVKSALRQLGEYTED
jgi:hypothetical protein